MGKKKRRKKHVDAKATTKTPQEITPPSPVPVLDKAFFQLALILVLAALGAYHNTFHSPFLFDDLTRIVANPDIRSLSHIPEKLFHRDAPTVLSTYRNDPSRPLVYFTYTLNYHLGKLNPFTYHVFNFLVHVLNAVLIFAFSLQLLSLTRLSTSRTVAFIPALLFAVHPMHIDAVTYAYGRSDLMAAFFCLLSLYAFLFEIKKKKIPILSLFAFVGALFSKQSSIALPAVVLALDWFAISRAKLQALKKNRTAHLAFWTTALAYLIYRFSYFGAIGDVEGGSFVVERSQYIFTQPLVITRYLGMLFVPIAQSIYHVVRPVSSVLEPKCIAPCFFLVLLALGFYWYWKKDRVSPVRSLAAFGIVWFLAWLAPVSTIMPTTQFMVERRMYLPAIGLYLAAIVFAYQAAKAISQKTNISMKDLRSPALVVIGLWVAALGLKTWHRNRLFRDPALVWNDAIATYPNTGILHKHLAIVYGEKKQYPKAIEQYQKTLAFAPYSYDCYHSLGLLYKTTHEYEKAREYLEKAVTLVPTNAVFRKNLAQFYFEMNDYKNAVKHLEQVLVAIPLDVQTRNALAVSYAKSGDTNRAVKHLRQTVALFPHNANTHVNLGTIYFDLQEWDKAEQAFKRALTLDSTSMAAKKNLGAVYTARAREAGTNSSP